jgi:hypothetical protein
MTVVKTAKKKKKKKKGGKYLNSLEKYHIYKATKQKLKLGDSQMVSYTTILDVLIKHMMSPSIHHTCLTTPKNYRYNPKHIAQTQVISPTHCTDTSNINVCTTYN